MKRTAKAFTLVEILLALAILGIGLVAILSLFAAGIHATVTALDTTRAGLAAQYILETLKQQGYQAGAYTVPLLQYYNGGNITDLSNLSFQLNTTQNPIGYISNWSKLELIASYASTGKQIGRFVTYITKQNP
jgi:prepilin-type N-terminal cleavage/methylation domain-containing protein